MSVKTKVPELYRSFTSSLKLLAAPWDTKAYLSLSESKSAPSKRFGRNVKDV